MTVAMLKQPTDLAAEIARENAARAARYLRVTVEGMGTVELLDWRERLEADRLEPGYTNTEDHALSLHITTTNLAAVDAELARRERVARISSGVVSPSDAKHSAWADVARELRDAVPVPVALERLSHPMRRVCRDRDGRDEYAGACLWCGGADRFRAWGPPRSRYWCRRCQTGGDVVTLWRNVTGLPFVDACEELLDIAGVPR